MSAPCPSSAPPYFTITYHIIAVISAPINIFGLYLVLYKSPGISKYKYCIFYVQTAAFLTEIHMSVVSPGYYFFPLLAGYSTTQPGDGSFISTHMTMVIWLFWLGNELPAIVWSFVYRHNAAENMHRVAQHSRIVKKFALSACQVFPILVSGCFYMSDITKEQAKVYLTNNYPQCLFWLESSAFTIYDWRTNPWVAVAGLGAIIFVSIFAGYAFLLGFRTMILLHKLRSHMSPATYKMHRTALFGLTLQVILPSVLIILPLFTCFLIIYNNLIDYQGVAVNSTILISLHSLCATVVMIAANPKYRKIVEGYLNLCSVSRTRKSTTCVAIELSSVNPQRQL